MRKGQSKNFDIQISNTFEVFKEFVNKCNYKFDFVRNKNDELYINNIEYTDDMNDNNKVLLEEVF